jgi:hypothetical protein
MAKQTGKSKFYFLTFDRFSFIRCTQCQLSRRMEMCSLLEVVQEYRDAGRAQKVQETQEKRESILG